MRGLVFLYRLCISPLIGPRCRYTPSCSTYAEQSLARHGWRGVPLIVKRLARCHPWHPGGFDPVP